MEGFEPSTIGLRPENDDLSTCFFITFNRGVRCLKCSTVHNGAALSPAKLPQVFLDRAVISPEADAAVADVETAARVRVAQLHRRSPAVARTEGLSPSGFMPFRNLNRSLSVDSTRVVFSAMVDW